MFDLGNAYTNLNKLFNKASSSVIEVTNYVCNKTSIRILYTRTEVHDILHISFSLEHDYAVCAFYIKGGKVDSYIPQEIFRVVKETFLFNNSYSTNLFFDTVREHILGASKYKEISKNDFSQYVRQANIKSQNDYDKKYFNHLRRAHLSSEMIYKIYRIVENKEEAGKIIRYLKFIGKTLVFVDDFERQKNLTLNNLKLLEEKA